MSTIINGTSSAITFPDSSIQNTSAIVSGYVPYANLPAGSVLQVVQATTSSSASSSSGTAITTGFSVSITPKFSTSKILIMLSAAVDTSQSNGQPNLTIYRGSTNLANSGGNQMSFNTSYGASSRLITAVNLNYLDSPATTSSTTYTVYMFNTGSSGSPTVFNAPNAANTNTATLIATEIAG